MSLRDGQYGPGSRSCRAPFQPLPTAPGVLSPLKEMLALHERKLAVCDTLEGIADSLPGRIDRLTCLRLANTLLPLINRAHHVEETTIFPAYDALPDTIRAIGSTERLQIEHVEDECFAAELTEILFKVGHEGGVANAEMFGFMLRGFFEGMRRHVAFEREHIAPLVGSGLLKDPPEV
jgi:hypothetical protein